MVKVSMEVNNLVNCCGVKELGYFNDDSYDEPVPEFSYYGGKGKTSTEAWKKSLDRCLEEHGGYVLQAWFVKGRDFNGDLEEDYKNKELRELIRAIPGVQHMGELENPNSKNIIDGYIWINK